MSFIVCFFVQKCIASDWKWGEGINPPSEHQTAMADGCKMRELKKLPIEDIQNESESDHNGILFVGLEVPPFAPIQQVVKRNYNCINFDLLPHQVLAEVVNSGLNKAMLRDAADTGEVITPISPTNPKYMGHGILFSLFRNINVDAEKRATGKLTVGTAFLASPNCLITAAHNIVLTSFVRKVPRCEYLSPYAERVEFWPLMNGFIPEFFDNGSLQDFGTRAISVKLHPQWDPQGSQCSYYDIAVLKLEKPLGLRFGCCPSREVSVNAAIGNQQIALSGYQLGEDGSISMIMTQCEGKISDAFSAKNKTFYNMNPQQETKKGQSGSGVRLLGCDLLLMSSSDVPSSLGPQHAPAMVKFSDGNYQWIINKNGDIKLVSISGSLDPKQLDDFFQQHYAQGKRLCNWNDPIVQYLVKEGHETTQQQIIIGTHTNASGTKGDGVVFTNELYQLIGTWITEFENSK